MTPQRIKDAAIKYMHSEIKGMVGDDELSPSNLQYAYEAGATAENYRAQGLVDAMEWIKTYGPVDELTVKFIDKNLAKWKGEGEYGA